MSDLGRDLRLALELADIADAMTMTAFTGQAQAFTSKDDGTPVTESDRLVEHRLRDALHERRPTDAFLGEETGARGEGERRWIVDPIDGTRSFIAGGSAWATQLALEVDHRVALGVTSAPALGRRWWGVVGAGAWCRRRGQEPEELHVSTAGGGTVRWSCHPPLAVLTGAWRQLAGRLHGLGVYVPPETHGVFDVAGGRIDLCLQLEGAPWDYGAFVGVIAGAGGRFSYLDGDEALGVSAPAIFSNGAVHVDALAQLGTG